MPYNSDRVSRVDNTCLSEVRLFNTSPRCVKVCRLYNTERVGNFELHNVALSLITKAKKLIFWEPLSPTLVITRFRDSAEPEYQYRVTNVISSTAN